MIRGDDVGAELVRTLRKIHQAERRLTQIAADLAELKQSELFRLRAEVTTAEATGQDLLADWAAQLKRDIADAHETLAALRWPATPRDELIRICLPEKQTWTTANEGKGLPPLDSALIGPMSTEELVEDEWVLDWVKREGELVAAGEPIAELKTAAHVFPVQSPVAGLLVEIRAKIGMIWPGSLLALVEPHGDH